MVKKEGEKVYQTAKEDAKRRRESNEKQRVEKQKRVDKVVSGVSFNTTLDKTAPTVDDMHEIEPPAGSQETLFAPAELVIDRATPVAEEEDFVEPEKEEPVTRKRRSTIESRESAAVEAENVEKEIKKNVEKPKKAYKFPPMNLLTRGKASGGDSDTYLRETDYTTYEAEKAKVKTEYEKITAREYALWYVNKKLEDEAAVKSSELSKELTKKAEEYREKYKESGASKEESKQSEAEWEDYANAIVEKYMQELTHDIIEMVSDASPEEKAMLQQKVSMLATKIK